MKSSFVLASLFSLAIAGPITARDETDPCACDFVCIQQVGPDCECEIRSKNQCYKDQLAAGLFQCKLQPLTPRCEATPLGKEGDGCLAFTKPVQPDCGFGLTCVLKNPAISDIGGTCQPIISSGDEGEKCGVKAGEPERKCQKGLECTKTVPGQCPLCLGTCKKPSSPTTYKPKARSVLNARVPPPGEEGEKCQTGRTLPGCVSGTVCVEDAPCFNPNAPCPGTCKKEEPKVCGTIVGLECEKGYDCVLDEMCTNGNTSDCPGKCVKTKVCGTIRGLECDAGFDCALDDVCTQQHGSDCPGKCVPTPTTTYHTTTI